MMPDKEIIKILKSQWIYRTTRFGCSKETSLGIFEGLIMVYVNDTAHLDNLIKHLKSVRGITAVTRFDSAPVEKAS